jgi:uncharacterized spore protein YtfJ
MAAEDAIKVTVDELLKALSARNILGDPIEMEDKVILPVTKMGMGFGTGVGRGSDDNSTAGAAGGAGGGVGVFPVAIVIVFKGIQGSEGVKVVPLSAPSAMAETMAELANAILNRIAGRKEGGEKKQVGPHSTSILVE